MSLYLPVLRAVFCLENRFLFLPPPFSTLISHFIPFLVQIYFLMVKTVSTECTVFTTILRRASTGVDEIRGLILNRFDPEIENLDQGT